VTDGLASSPGEVAKEAIAAGWDAIWNRGEPGAVDELMAPGYVREAANLAPQDREQLKATVVAVRTSFPDFRIDIDQILAEGSTVATRWTCSGTHTQAFGGVPPTRQHVVLRGVTISTFEGGRVVSDWLTWDPLDMVRALGIVFIGETPPVV
jgi:steroid delta-isomerase-like uncharacterized protein